MIAAAAVASDILLSAVWPTITSVQQDHTPHPSLRSRRPCTPRDSREFTVVSRELCNWYIIGVSTVRLVYLVQLGAFCSLPLVMFIVFYVPSFPDQHA